MPKSQSKQLHAKLLNDPKIIQNEMEIEYVAVPIPIRIYQKSLLKIKEHNMWYYDDRYKVIIAPIEEANQVQDLIKATRNEIVENLPENSLNQNFLDDTIGCCYVCKDFDNPVLTNYPITIYNKDGSHFTNKMCRECLAITLRFILEPFMKSNSLDYDKLYRINQKPNPIPTIGFEKDLSIKKQIWPQIPLGQIITALMLNDEELSYLVSLWIYIVTEYSIRVTGVDFFTFCPNHPKHIFRYTKAAYISEADDKKLKINCKNPTCENIFCFYCDSWHPENFVCDVKKSGAKYRWEKRCPRCDQPVFKEAGCNHISCTCGCHFCYKCLAGFSTAQDCYNHLHNAHGGFF